jgi:hypothetical protein
VLGLDSRRENQIKLDAAHSDMCRFNPSAKKDMDIIYLLKETLPTYPANISVSTHKKRWGIRFRWISLTEFCRKEYIDEEEFKGRFFPHLVKSYFEHNI